MATIMTRGRRGIALLAALLVAAGCGAGQRSDGGPARADSAGVSSAAIGPAHPAVTVPDLSPAAPARFGGVAGSTPVLSPSTPPASPPSASASAPSPSPSFPPGSMSASASVSAPATAVGPTGRTSSRSSSPRTTSTPTGTAAGPGVGLGAPVTVTDTVPGGRVVALTFDDGPGVVTAQVLDILDRTGVPATFCQIGRQVPEFPDTERRLGASRYGICDHTWDHDEDLRERSATAMAAEIDRTQAAVLTATGRTPRYFRAPGGNWGAPGSLLRRVVGGHGLRALGWAVDSEDWRKPGVARIVATVMSEVRPGAIVLMHDAGGNRSQTVAALPLVIARIRAAGYIFVALP